MHQMNTCDTSVHQRNWDDNHLIIDDDEIFHHFICSKSSICWCQDNFYHGCEAHRLFMVMGVVFLWELRMWPRPGLCGFHCLGNLEKPGKTQIKNWTLTLPMDTFLSLVANYWFITPKCRIKFGGKLLVIIMLLLPKLNKFLFQIDNHLCCVAMPYEPDITECIVFY